MKIKIGAKVSPKKIGYPVIGIVCGQMTGEIFFKQHEEVPFDAWDRYYPDWRKKNVVYVQFPTPIPPITKEELSYVLKGVKSYELENIYKKMGLVSLASYPIDDLEVLQ